MLSRNESGLSTMDSKQYNARDEIQAGIDAEESRLSAILRSDTLRHFGRRIEHWDLLIRIMENRHNSSVGLNDIALLCRHGTLHHQSLAKFLREQIAAGIFYTEQGDRRDKKIVRATDQLVADFLALTRR